jgi:hypothetical protein
MFAMTITIAVLAVLYGLAWHNQPAREALRTVAHATKEHEANKPENGV